MPLFGPNVAKLKAKKDVNGLVKALGNKDVHIWSAASVALREIGTPAVKPLLNMIDQRSGIHKTNDIHFRAKSLLLDMGPIAPGIFVELLTHDSAVVQELAIEALAKVKDPRVLDPMVHILTTNDVSSMRETAAKTLGNIDDPRAIDALKSALRDNNAYVIQVVAKALNNLNWEPDAQGDPVTAAYYWNATWTDDGILKCAAIGEPAIEPLLHHLTVISWRSKSFRATIIKVLAEIGAPAVPALMQVASHPRSMCAKMWQRCWR